VIVFAYSVPITTSNCVAPLVILFEFRIVHEANGDIYEFRTLKTPHVV